MIKFHKIIITALALSCFVLFGCGGGTSGTDSGGRDLRILGNITDANLLPVANAEVTILETGDQALSDNAGNFVIESSTDANAFNIEIHKSGVRAATLVDNLPENSSKLNLSLSFDSENGLVTVLNVTITPLVEESRTLQPKPTSNQEVHESQAAKDAPSESDDYSAQAAKDNEYSIFSGRVVFDDGSPVSKVKITVKQTEKSDLTSQNGKFSIATPLVSGNVAIVLEYGGLKDKLIIPNVPHAAVNVDLQLELNIERPQSPNPSPLQDGMRSYNGRPKIKLRLVKYKINKRSN